MEGFVERNLGLVMAYLVPGFVGLLCAEDSAPIVRAWFGAAEGGSWLPLLLASLACGMVTSALRWAVLDWAHAVTGLAPPALRLDNLSGRLDAFEAVIHNHYRYYQGYGNLLVAMVAGVGLFGSWPTVLQSRPVFSVLTYFALVVTLFAASRDSLRKAYTRCSELLSFPSHQERHDDEWLASRR